MPVRDEESIWLGLESVEATPVALRVLVRVPDTLDAVSGLPAAETLDADPQNYLVVPPQAWLDGVTVTPQCARQFVRVADGGQHAAVLEFRLVAIPAKPAVTRLGGDYARMDRSVRRPTRRIEAGLCGLAGHAEQTVFSDPYGSAAWNVGMSWDARVELVSGAQFESATGQPAPAPTEAAAKYGGWRLP